jgi:hypothetical protein
MTQLNLQRLRSPRHQLCELDRILRTLCGLSRDGLLVPGKPPHVALPIMANFAWRNRFYQPPLPRWLYWMIMGTMAPFGARGCDRMIARYNDDLPPPTNQT